MAVKIDKVLLNMASIVYWYERTVPIDSKKPALHWKKLKNFCAVLSVIVALFSVSITFLHWLRKIQSSIKSLIKKLHTTCRDDVIPLFHMVLIEFLQATDDKNVYKKKVYVFI